MQALSAVPMEYQQNNFFKSDRLCLRRINGVDASRLLAQRAGANVAASLHGEASPPSIAWEVLDQSRPDPVGVIACCEPSPLCAQIDFRFAYDPWNASSLPLEALSGVLDWVFTRSEKTQRIQVTCVSTALVAKSYLECLAMGFEGTHHAMARLDEEIADVDFYAMTRATWKSGGNDSRGWRRRYNNDGGHV